MIELNLNGSSPLVTPINGIGFVSPILGVSPVCHVKLQLCLDIESILIFGLGEESNHSKSKVLHPSNVTSSWC